MVLNMLYEEIKRISREIYAKIVKGSKTPMGSVKGGEYLVYLNKNKLTYTNHNTADAQIALNDPDSVICLIAYYDTPDFNRECTIENISNKIESSLIEKGIINK